MPYHRIQRDDNVSTSVAEVEANGEEIVQVFTEGDKYVIWTRRIGALTDTGSGLVFKQVDAMQTTDSTTVAVLTLNPPQA